MEKHFKINNGKSLSAIVGKIVNESVKSALYRNAVDEKEKQQKFLGEEDDDLFGGEEGGGDEKPTASKTIEDEQDKLKKGNIEAEDVVEKLNAIRGGKSFKDEEIAKKLEEYVDSLTKAEKTALLAFLKGLSQIVTGEVEPKQATDPGKNPADVKMKKGEEKQKKSLKPNVIKAPPKEEKKEKPSKEDTSGPVPITPKKK